MLRFEDESYEVGGDLVEEEWKKKKEEEDL